MGGAIAAAASRWVAAARGRGEAAVEGGAGETSGAGAVPISEEFDDDSAQRLANLSSQDYPRVQFVQAKSTLYSPSHMHLTVNQSLCIAFMLVLLLLCVPPAWPTRMHVPSAAHARVYSASSGQWPLHRHCARPRRAQ